MSEQPNTRQIRARLQTLIQLVNDSYPDGKLQEALDTIRECKSPTLVGDGLATFIVCELEDAMHDDTWDRCLIEAEDMLRRATYELDAVRIAVANLVYKEFEEHKPVK